MCHAIVFFMHRRFPLFALTLLATTLPGLAQNLTEHYKDTADRLIDAALADREGYDRLTYLCYRIGNRLSGSPALEKAISWSVEQMKAAGLSNVRVIPTKVPHWVRGAESGRILTPLDRPLHMLGLGMSAGTPPGGITAEAISVPDFDTLDKLGRDKIQGKIVVYDYEFRGYGSARNYRSSGASRAAALGAVAVLVRSATPLAMQTPHTGAMEYTGDAPHIPAAAISPEDTYMITRLIAGGTPVRIHLEMGSQMLPDADSGDVIGEIQGKEHPEEVVVIGGHIDSWDVGQGAQDDGASIMACLEALSIIKKLGLEPRRTLRVAFWVNEENGGRGGDAYRAFVGDDIKNQVVALEMDGGAETPRGFGASVDPASLEMLKQIGKLLERIGASEIAGGGGGEDIRPLVAAGVPAMSERAAGTHYFDWHHSEADTLDKVDPTDFRKSVAALAVMGFALADMPTRVTASAGGRGGRGQ